MKRWAAGALAVMFLCHGGASAQADQGGNLSVILSSVRYAETGLETARPVALGVVWGAPLGEHLAVEGRLLTGIYDDAITVSGLRREISLEYCLALHGKAIKSLSPAWSAFAMLGIARAKFSGGAVATPVVTSGGSVASATGVNRSDVQASYGVGVEYAIGARMALRVEWLHLLEGPNYKVEGSSIGITGNF